MSFPITYRELERLARKTFLHTMVARGVARKAGLVSHPPTASRPRTVIDGYVNPLESPLGRQYAADFTGQIRMRLTSQSSVPIYVHYSLQVDNPVLDPTDYQPLWGYDESESFTTLSASQAESVSGADLRWLTIPEFLRVPLRLAVSTQEETPAMNPDLLDGSFSMALQAL